MKEKAEFKIMDKQVVDSLLAMNTKNRNVRKHIVDQYVKEIREGRWVATNQGIGVSESGVLLDGQHRLIALQKCGYPPVRMLLVTGLSDEAQTAVDQHAKRIANDHFKLLFDTTVTRVAPAICTLLGRWDGENLKRNGAPLHLNVLCLLMHKYGELIHAVCETSKCKTFFAASYMAGFVAVADETGDIEKVKAFMNQVENGEMLTRDMPAYHLRNYISISRSSGCSAQAERFLKAVKACKAFIDGKSMGVLKL